MNEDEQARLWNTLEEISKNVQKIDKALGEHITENKSITEKLEDHQKKLYGNGKDGLIIVVDRLDKSKERSNKLAWLLIASIITLFSTMIWNNFFVKPASQQNQNTAIHTNNKTP